MVTIKTCSPDTLAMKVLANCEKKKILRILTLVWNNNRIRYVKKRNKLNSTNEK